MEQAAREVFKSPSLKGFKYLETGGQQLGLVVDWVVLGLQLDLIILRIFSNLSISMTL